MAVEKKFFIVCYTRPHECGDFVETAEVFNSSTQAVECAADARVNGGSNIRIFVGHKMKLVTTLATTE